MFQKNNLNNDLKDLEFAIAPQRFDNVGVSEGVLC
jgi:hypothetical protein